LGNDTLIGGMGTETYVFNRGEGQDTIRDKDIDGASTDSIVFGEGIEQAELQLRREGNHMVIMIGGADSGDSITIENAYTDSRYRIEEIVFADETVIAGSAIFELPEYIAPVID